MSPSDPNTYSDLFTNTTLQWPVHKHKPMVTCSQTQSYSDLGPTRKYLNLLKQNPREPGQQILNMAWITGIRTLLINSLCQILNSEVTERDRIYCRPVRIAVYFLQVGSLMSILRDGRRIYNFVWSFSLHVFVFLVRFSQEITKALTTVYYETMWFVFIIQDKLVRLLTVVLCFIWWSCLGKWELFCIFHSNYLLFTQPPPGGICFDALIRSVLTYLQVPTVGGAAVPFLICF